MFLRIVTVLGIASIAAVLAGAGAVSYARAATTGLVAAYGFNDGSGTVLSDLSGNGNTGTVSNATWTSGRYGGALDFNGSSSMVTVPSNASISPTGAVTLEAWVRPATVADWSAVAIKEQTATQLSYGLYSSSDTGAAALVYTNGEKNAKSASKLPANTWSHLAAVYSGSSLSIYVNGTLAGQSSVSGAIAAGTRPLRIGGDSIWNEWFRGQIDELRVYNRALTASEIQSDMATPIGSSAPADTSAPTAPAAFTAGAMTQTSIPTSWAASTDNTAVTGYNVYNGATKLGTTTATSYTASGLTCATSYTLGVEAFDAAGNTSARTNLTAKTPACSDTSAPTVPTAFAAGTTTQTSIPTSWAASTDNTAVTGYGIYLSGVLVSSSTTRSYTFTGLTCGTAYALAVDAFDAAGNRSTKATATTSTAVCSDTSAPTAPAAFTAGAMTQTSIPTSWAASTDNTAVTGYNVYNGATKLGTTTATSYTASGLTCATSYTLGVEAFDAAGNTSARTNLTAKTPACPPPPPSGSANLWVDTNGGSCARQATAGGYTDATACGSFQAAYSAAQCGDTVGVRAGSYGSQSISSGTKSCSASSQVRFTSVPGASCSDNTTVSMPAFSISVAYVQLHCMNANPTTTTSCISVSGASGMHTSIVYVSLDQMAMHCAFFDSDHLKVTNSTFGPDNTCQTAQEDLVVFRANSTSITDVLFDHVTFATVTAPPDFQCGVGKHVDSMQGYGIANLVISHSVFYGCPGQCIIFRPFSGGTPGPITIENSLFNQAQSPGQAIDIGSSTASDGDNCNGTILIQNNTFVNGAALHGGCWNNPTVIFRNNIMSGSTCNFGGSGDTYTNNVFYSGTSCGTNPKNCTPSYVAGTTSTTSPGDFHLAPTDTCAKGAASQTAGTYASDDIDGQARPNGPADAGFDEIP